MSGEEWREGPDRDILFRQIDAISTQIMGLEKRLGDRLDEMKNRMGLIEDRYVEIRENSARFDERMKTSEAKIIDQAAKIDHAFSKVRAVDEKIGGVNLKIAYWSGGFAVGMFILKFALDKVKF